MFKLPKPDERLKVSVPVSIPVPQDGGTVRKHEIDVTFELPLQDEVDQVLARQDEDAPDLIEKYIVGADRIQDHAGNPMPYSDELKTSLLNVTYARKAITRAFFATLAGEGRRGN
ncbi:hypothetical protein IGB42_02632 [Andreprevotia sp. IGB-42]|uniref:hypothetical protein n=1 Tax=Andreprevotia sp. IGB-42 TaxID=2497473 RepID=UPI00135749DD|nr:hypothetical protein [Andreprevotia sp. IGB-42]KAF0812789.1 hypothetical protein IGB42_02632 [Andreprevotia sp. IGB-42]